MMVSPEYTNNSCSGKNHGSQSPSSRKKLPPLKCPRCDSTNTKFCYYNNYSLTQPRHFCKTCRRYWTEGGALRDVPVGGGCRKAKKMKSSITEHFRESNTRLWDQGTFHLNRFSDFGNFSKTFGGVSSSPNFFNLPPQRCSPQSAFQELDSSPNFNGNLSMSCINTDLHLKLQQLRSGDSHKRNSIASHATTIEAFIQMPQPVLIRNPEPSPLGASRKDGSLAIETPLHTPNWSGNQAWSELSQYIFNSVLP